MSKILGNNVIVLASDISTAETVPIAYARNCEVDTDMEFKEKSSPSTGQWKEYIARRGRWSVSVSCLLSDDESAIMSAYASQKLLGVYFQDAIGSEWFFGGSAYIKRVKATGPMDQMATFQVEFIGNGALSYEVE
jgi:predicted secreted protein